MTGSRRKDILGDDGSQGAELAVGHSDRQRREPRRPKGLVTLIDEAFARGIDITTNGVRQRGTVLEGIVLQLFRKVLLGDKRAIRVLMMYQTFGIEYGDRSATVEMVFVENDYTRAMKALGRNATKEKAEFENG